MAMASFSRSVGRIASGSLFGRVPLVAVVGAPRSGSTLLIRILDSHSRIAAPCEIGIPAVFPQEDEKHALVVKKWAQICTHYEVDPQRAELDSYVLFRAILRREHKRILVLKDPRASLYIDELDRYRPRYVHLVRDARSVASSRMFSEPAIGYRKWLAYNQSVLSFFSDPRRRPPVRVRYENLVAKPEFEIRTLLAALGISFEPAMLAFGDFEHADDRLRLWGDQAPADSSLQHDLGESVRPEPDAPIWSSPVLALYGQLPHVQELNRVLGYR